MCQLNNTHNTHLYFVYKGHRDIKKFMNCDKSVIDTLFRIEK